MTTEAADQAGTQSESGGSHEHEDRKPTVEELHADVEQTRAELADTVDALAGKLDLKARARARARASTERVSSGLRAGRARAMQLGHATRARVADRTTGPATPVVAIASGSLLAVVITLIVLRRRAR